MSEHNLCQEFLSQVSDYLDNLVDPITCEELERHLVDCTNCRIFVDTLKKTVYLYQQREADIELPGGVRERLFKVLSLDDLVR
ncbi:MAG: zf-HC2 domain-containing protein [Anaerolineales bacterium]|nr:zf-HC2 domain-containing protein [Anaerolineales bacterium]TET97619.1 MAG: zf-HC2 domain-containing protein [Anaerolineales bacterium]